MGTFYGTQVPNISRVIPHRIPLIVPPPHMQRLWYYFCLPLALFDVIPRIPRRAPRNIFRPATFCYSNLAAETEGYEIGLIERG